MNAQERRISRLIGKEYPDALVAHIEGVDVGLVRSVRIKRNEMLLAAAIEEFREEVGALYLMSARQGKILEKFIATKPVARFFEVG